MTYKVMIADDEPIMRKAMSTLIRWEDLDCDLIYAAANGNEVMENLELLHLDILVLDIQMPGKSGIDIAKYIWENKIPVKVILLTAYADFSYAQAGIQYKVIDYVIKTGAMEGLVAAINKAKECICEEAVRQSEESIIALQENFLKAVCDGSMYDKKEIMETAEKLQINLDFGYLPILIHFRAIDKAENKYQQRTYQSLLNFLKMVFGEKMSHGFAIKRSVLVVLLTNVSPDFREPAREKCIQIIDMMENFMKMYVSIGIGEQPQNVLELKSEYDKAEFAIGHNFFNEGSHISFYQKDERESPNKAENLENYKKELFYLLRKGSSQEALQMFERILEMQKMNGEPVNAVLYFGISIRDFCRRVLMEYDKNLYDLTSFQNSISKMIYQCMHVSEYKDIMEKIISSTAEYISMVMSKKSMLIYESEKYINENYEKNITVADVAECIGASPSYLSRIFKQSTGNTIIHYINMKKINKAKEYLAAGDMKIYEIADRLGFENTTYFSHFFKKHTGISPKDYK